MEELRYKTERERPYRERRSIGLTGVLGGCMGAGSGLITGIAYGTIKGLLLYEIPGLLNGKNIASVLADSIAHGYSVGVDTAIVGGVLGLLLAVKFRDAIEYVLWGKRR